MTFLSSLSGFFGGNSNAQSRAIRANHSGQTHQHASTHHQKKSTHVSVQQQNTSPHARATAEISPSEINYLNSLIADGQIEVSSAMNLTPKNKSSNSNMNFMA